MNDLKAIVIHRSNLLCKYLSGIRCFCFGKKVLAFYDADCHMAMPLTEDQARNLLSLLCEEFPPESFRYDEKNNIPALCFSIVDYPASEVTGNG